MCDFSHLYWPTPFQTNPQEILLSRMNLSSTIPSSLGNLGLLENLELYGNKLEGELPNLSGNKNLKVSRPTCHVATVVQINLFASSSSSSLLEYYSCNHHRLICILSSSVFLPYLPLLNAQRESTYSTAVYQALSLFR